MKVRTLTTIALAATCVSVLSIPAHAREQVCIPGYGSTTVTILGKDYTLPGHSLPCQDLP